MNVCRLLLHTLKTYQQLIIQITISSKPLYFILIYLKTCNRTVYNRTVYNRTQIQTDQLQRMVAYLIDRGRQA